MPAKRAIHPSPAIVVRADQPIGDCVRLMRDRNVGSVLVVNDTEAQDLVGIFTERDLVQKIDLIEQGDHWRRPIRTVMTKPVQTLDVGSLDEAPEFLLKYGVRHVPLVMKERNGKERLVGVVSMRDLFKQLVAPIDEEALAGVTPVYALFSKDAYFGRLVKSGLTRWRGVILKDWSAAGVLASKAPIAILDVDGLSGDKWAATLRSLNKRAGGPFIAIVFDPTLHDADTVKALEKLGTTSRISIFEKPLPIPALFDLLQSRLGQ